jgi:homopolymeric O-antigen transport system permease protein
MSVALESPPASPPNAGTGPAREQRITRIAPRPGWARVDLAELWGARGVLWFLAWRDIKVRYSQTVLGSAWAVLQPLLSTAVFAVIFGRVARMPSDGVPYPLFAFAALVPWTYFAAALTGAANSLVANTSLITKVYFPRLAIPLAAVFSTLVDFSVSFAVLLAVLIGRGMWPNALVLALPGLLLVAMLTAAGAGCWLAALNIQYRDVKQIVPFLVQLWMYGSPIVYPLSLVPEHWRPILSLNPMVGVISGFRAALLGTGRFDGTELAISTVSALVIFGSGVLYYRRTESIFADVA